MLEDATRRRLLVGTGLASAALLVLRGLQLCALAFLTYVTMK